MTKVKAAGVLGVLVLCGLLVLASLATAAGDPFFRQFQQALRQKCIAESHPTGSRVERAACLFFADALNEQTLPIVLNETDEALVGGIVARALVDALEEGLPQKCDECIQAADDFETAASSNHTEGQTTLGRALAMDCEQRFKKPADVSRCTEIVGKLTSDAPVSTVLGIAISNVLTNFPPGILCQDACSLNESTP